MLALRSFLPLTLGLTLSLQQPAATKQEAPAQKSTASTSQTGPGVAGLAIFATITDRNGRPMTDLTGEEIRIFEDGVERQIDFFAPDSTAAVLAGVLVDISGSRRDEKTRGKVQDALWEFLHTGLRRQDSAYIMAFGDQNYLLTDLTNNVVEFEGALRKIAVYTPHGSTALYDAIYAAASAGFAGRTGRRVLLVLSDFQDNASRHRVDEAIHKAQETDTAVFCLVDGMSPEAQASKRFSKKARLTAHEIANQTGGGDIVFESQKALVSAFEQVRQNLQNFYVIRYRSSDTALDTKSHKLKIVVLRKGAEVLARGAYRIRRD